MAWLTVEATAAWRLVVLRGSTHIRLSLLKKLQVSVTALKIRLPLLRFDHFECNIRCHLVGEHWSLFSFRLNRALHELLIPEIAAAPATKHS